MQKPKQGMKLHKWIALGGKPSAFKGRQGEIQTAKTDAAQVGAELKEKSPK